MILKLAYDGWFFTFLTRDCSYSGHVLVKIKFFLKKRKIALYPTKKERIDDKIKSKSKSAL